MLLLSQTAVTVRPANQRRRSTVQYLQYLLTSLLTTYYLLLTIYYLLLTFCSTTL